jgi:hypothetical protein
MFKAHCPQLRIQLQNIKAQYDAYVLELEKVKNSKEYEQAWNIQAQITQAILELGVIVNPDNYIEVYISEIEKKSKANIPLTKAEIIFLYNTYGQAKDPRIAEILQTRNPKEDAPIVFDCQPQEIAWDVNQIDENTKAYIGPWNGDVFHVLIGYPNINHLYESFPDKKIFMQTLETDPSINSPAKAEQALAEKDIGLTLSCKYILKKTEFSQIPEVYNLVRFRVEQLGLKQDATTDEIYKRAKELALEQCPAEVGPQLRLQYTGRELFLIAMKQIADRDGYPCVFRLYGGGRLALAGSDPVSGQEWRADRSFVFRFRTSASSV